jgi:hypothetical protein
MLVARGYSQTWAAKVNPDLHVFSRKSFPAAEVVEGGRIGRVRGLTIVLCIKATVRSEVLCGVWIPRVRKNFMVDKNVNMH